MKKLLLFIMSFFVLWSTFWVWVNQSQEWYETIEACEQAIEVGNEEYPSYERSNCYEKEWLYYYNVCEWEWCLQSSNDEDPLQTLLDTFLKKLLEKANNLEWDSNIFLKKIIQKLEQIIALRSNDQQLVWAFTYLVNELKKELINWESEFNPNDVLWSNKLDCSLTWPIANLYYENDRCPDVDWYNYRTEHSKEPVVQSASAFRDAIINDCWTDDLQKCYNESFCTNWYKYKFSNSWWEKSNSCVAKDTNDWKEDSDEKKQCMITVNSDGWLNWDSFSNRTLNECNSLCDSLGNEDDFFADWWYCFWWWDLQKTYNVDDEWADNGDNNWEEDNNDLKENWYKNGEAIEWTTAELDLSKEVVNLWEKFSYTVKAEWWSNCMLEFKDKNWWTTQTNYNGFDFTRDDISIEKDSYVRLRCLHWDLEDRSWDAPDFDKKVYIKISDEDKCAAITSDDWYKLTSEPIWEIKRFTRSEDIRWWELIYSKWWKCEDNNEWNDNYRDETYRMSCNDWWLKQWNGCVEFWDDGLQSTYENAQDATYVCDTYQWDVTFNYNYWSTPATNWLYFDTNDKPFGYDIRMSLYVWNWKNLDWDLPWTIIRQIWNTHDCWWWNSWSRSSLKTWVTTEECMDTYTCKLVK